MLLKAAIPFNFSSPEYLSHHRTRKNRVSPVSRASPAHMNSPLDLKVQYKHKIKLPLDIVIKHVLLYLRLPDY